MQSSNNAGNEMINRCLLKELFEKSYGKVYKKAFMILFDAEMAKDATQEVFLKAFQKIDTLKEMSKFDAWVHAIAQNTCRNMIKKNHYRNKNIVLYDNEDRISYNIDEFNGIDIPENIFENKELRGELHKYINDLEQDEQNIIHLRLHYDFTYKQIANHLNIKEGTVKSKVHRAKEKIYYKLQKYNNVKGTVNYGPKF